MAQPAIPAPEGQLELTVHDVRSRLIPLVRMADLTGRVTIITEAGRQLAALVPADAARSRDQARAAAAQHEAAARGWEQRLDAVREQVRAQHRVRIRELEQALAGAWELIDDIRPPGVNRAADLLRAEHRDLFPRPG